MIVIDIEASALVDGYPIEIAWACTGSDCRAYLIKPSAELVAHTNWDPVSQSIHGLSREQLEQRGMPIDEVIESLNRDLAGEKVVSDAPSHDWSWLQVLLEFSNIERFTFEMLKLPVDSLLLREANERGTRGVQLRYLLERQERAHIHTAAHDAAAWAATFDALPLVGLSDMAAVDQIFEAWWVRASDAAPWRETPNG